MTTENSGKLEHVSHELDIIKSQLELVSHQASLTNQLQQNRQTEQVFSDRQVSDPNPISAISPINQQSLFEIPTGLGLTNNQTDLISNTNSGEKLRNFVSRLNSDHIERENLQASLGFQSQYPREIQDLINRQNSMIKQFQSDLHKQEEIIERQSRHIEALEQVRYQESLQNPSSSMSQNLQHNPSQKFDASAQASSYR